MAKKILVVEDNEMLADIYEMKLGDEHGFDIKIATTGTQALVDVRDWQPDLLILDLMLPEVDGFEVLERLHKEKITDKLPIIVVTALKDTESINKALELGARDYFAKSDVLTEDVVDQCKKLLN